MQKLPTATHDSMSKNERENRVTRTDTFLFKKDNKRSYLKEYGRCQVVWVSPLGHSINLAESIPDLSPSSAPGSPPLVEGPALAACWCGKYA